jgi:nanoRNase/pAp phosphatase (c-di-AMP/oligoRNAs hydrolase)
LRSTERDRHAGKIARNLGGRRGFGGGHHTLAAAQIPLPLEISGGRRLRRMVKGLTKRFLKATGGEDDPAESLCT